MCRSARNSENFSFVLPNDGVLSIILFFSIFLVVIKTAREAIGKELPKVLFCICGLFNDSLDKFILCS